MVIVSLLLVFGTRPFIAENPTESTSREHPARVISTNASVEGVEQRPREDPLRAGVLGVEFVEEGQPRGLAFGAIGPNSLETVTQMVNSLEVKVPDEILLPEGFSVVAATYTNSSSSYEFKGKWFSLESVTLYFWDKSVETQTKRSHIMNDGGFAIRLSYALGDNESMTELSKILERQSGKPHPLSYIDGNPAFVNDGYIELFHLEEQVSYELSGNYPKEVLMEIMRFIMRR